VVNKLIDLVKKFEARREGVPSQVNHPLIQQEFFVNAEKTAEPTGLGFQNKIPNNEYLSNTTLLAEPMIHATLK
jgi:hypothetical protein